jgi:hypothetical protein
LNKILRSIFIFISPGFKESAILTGSAGELSADVVKESGKICRHGAQSSDATEADDTRYEGVLDQILTGFVPQQIEQNTAIVLHFRISWFK